MSRVSALTMDGDWTFGQGIANYLIDREAVKQNIATRLKSFKNDWFLDLDANIDWIRLLGEKNTKDRIVAEVERVILSTENVVKINNIEVIEDRKIRDLRIIANVSTIFSSNLFLDVSI